MVKLFLSSIRPQIYANFFFFFKLFLFLSINFSFFERLSKNSCSFLMFAEYDVMDADNKKQLELINDRFNEELSRQVQGKLAKGHIYQLGRPCAILLSTGFPDHPIELSSTRLEEKSKQNNHPFKIEEVKDLVLALNDPIAVFVYGDRYKSQNVIVGLKKDDKNFVVGIFFNQFIRGNQISSVRGLFNKYNAEWLNWISQGKALYLDKKKIQILIDQQRTDLADVEYLDLNLVESIVRTFINPL